MKVEPAVAIEVADRLAHAVAVEAGAGASGLVGEGAGPDEAEDRVVAVEEGEKCPARRELQDDALVLEQLEAALVRLGYDPDGTVTVDGTSVDLPVGKIVIVDANL